MSKLLLREFHELCADGYCLDLLTEEERTKRTSGTVYLTGVMQRADAQNGNGRVYKKDVLQREIENYHKLVQERRALGELDHPDDSVVNLKNVSHLVTRIWWENDDVMGTIEVLSTPSGQVLKSLVEAGCKLGISSRGMGSVKEEKGQTIVEDDFLLICFDIVSDPSTKDAWMMPQKVNESKIINNFTKEDKINRALNDVLRGIE
jgi:hypothetical protein